MGLKSIFSCTTGGDGALALYYCWALSLSAACSISLSTRRDERLFLSALKNEVCDFIRMAELSSAFFILKNVPDFLKPIFDGVSLLGSGEKSPPLVSSFLSLLL